MADTTLVVGQAPVNPWQNLLERVTVIFDRYALFFLPDQKEYHTKVLALMDLVASIREYAILTVEDLEAVWVKLRNDQFLLDLIIAVTGDIFLEQELDFSEVAKRLALSILLCAHTELKSSDTAMDDAFRETMLTPDAYHLLLMSNPWFVTLCLLRRSGRLNLVRVSQSAKSPAAEAAS